MPIIVFLSAPCQSQPLPGSLKGYLKPSVVFLDPLVDVSLHRILNSTKSTGSLGSWPNIRKNGDSPLTEWEWYCSSIVPATGTRSNLFRETGRGAQQTLFSKTAGSNSWNVAAAPSGRKIRGQRTPFCSTRRSSVGAVPIQAEINVSAHPGSDAASVSRATRLQQSPLQSDDNSWRTPGITAARRPLQLAAS